MVQSTEQVSGSEDSGQKSTGKTGDRAAPLPARTICPVFVVRAEDIFLEAAQTGAKFSATTVI